MFLSSPTDTVGAPAYLRGLVEFDGFLGPLRVQDLNPSFKMFVLFHELLYCLLLLGAVEGGNPHSMHHDWKPFLIDLRLLAHYCQSAIILLQLLLCLLRVGY